MARSKSNTQVKVTAVRSDFVAHGSEQHARMLNIRPANGEDDPDLVHKEQTFIDFTRYGFQASDRFLKATLIQKVNEWENPPQTPQSDDPTAPNYAPAMFDPDDYEGNEFTEEELQAAVATLVRAGYLPAVR